MKTNLEKGLKDEVVYWLQDLIEEDSKDKLGKKCKEILEDEEKIEKVVKELLSTDKIWEVMHRKIESYIFEI